MRGKATLVPMLFLGLVMTTLVADGECMGNPGKTITLKGTVRVVGNEPFARLVLTVPGPEGGGRPADHLVEGPLAAEIRERHQGRIVTVECRPCAEKQPGRLPCIEPEKIIKVE
ncbi:MAG: hypothetical protein IH577_04840 [Deltaproteobacteria bacterium]|nr:hypothetical protein [Deltaproteobacteria bacterium]